MAQPNIVSTLVERLCFQAILPRGRNRYVETPATDTFYSQGLLQSTGGCTFIIYQMEAVIPIERVIVIFSGKRVFAVKIMSYNTAII